MFDKSYYEQRKQELNNENIKNILEAYDDIERAVIKKINKQRELQAKLQDLEAKEKESQKKTLEVPKTEPKTAKQGRNKDQRNNES